MIEKEQIRQIEKATKKEHSKHEDGNYRPEVEKVNHDAWTRTKKRNDEAVTEDTV